MDWFLKTSNTPQIYSFLDELSSNQENKNIQHILGKSTLDNTKNSDAPIIQTNYFLLTKYI